MYAELLGLERASGMDEKPRDYRYWCQIAGIREKEPKYMKRDLKNALRTVKEATGLDFTVEWRNVRFKDGTGDLVPVRFR